MIKPCTLNGFANPVSNLFIHMIGKPIIQPIVQINNIFICLNGLPVHSTLYVLLIHSNGKANHSMANQTVQIIHSPIPMVCLSVQNFYSSIQMADQTIQILYSTIQMVCPSVRNFYSSIWMADQTVQIIYSPIWMVRQTVQTLQGLLVNRLSSDRFAFHDHI